MGRRRRNQPAPPFICFEALTQPNRDPARQWLALAPDETHPVVLDRDSPHLVVWSTLWPERPDAQIHFDLPYDSRGQGTDLTWTLLVNEPEPAPSALGYFRKRLNVIINTGLRYSFGQ